MKPQETQHIDKEMLAKDLEEIRNKLIEICQENVLQFEGDLSETEKMKLISQLKLLNLSQLKRLAEEYVVNKPTMDIPKNIQAVPMYSRVPKPAQKSLYRDAEKRGRELVRAGKVGAFLVAGGQGTRLGYDGPKGEYSVTPIKGKSLFQVFAEQLLSYSEEGGRAIPWYIMTSDINIVATKSFFEENNYFGYKKEDIFFFQQGMMPAFSMDGKLLLADKDSLALSPDGHGGSLRALKLSGALDDMKRRGVEHLSYFQVDNPLVHCIDYTFIGLHDLTKSEMSSKTIPKASPVEKVGNFVAVNGVVQVIEYSDMPESLATQKNPDGSLMFNAGSIAIHALATSFIERLNANGELNLPWHRAEKKVAYVNAQGVLVKPEKPNAVKLEQFIFDAIPLAKNALVYETDRAEEFSPVKNAEGNDSPITCREHQVARGIRWLQSAGIRVHEDVKVEIDPQFAVSAQQLKQLALAISEIPAGSMVYFGRDGIEGLPVAAPRGLMKKVLISLGKLIGARPKPAQTESIA